MNNFHNRMNVFALGFIAVVVLGYMLTLFTSFAMAKWSEWGIERERRITVQVYQEGETDRTRIMADRDITIEAEREQTKRVVDPDYLTFWSARGLLFTVIVAVLVILLMRLASMLILGV